MQSISFFIWDNQRCIKLSLHLQNWSRPQWWNLPKTAPPLTCRHLFNPLESITFCFLSICGRHENAHSISNITLVLLHRFGRSWARWKALEERNTMSPNSPRALLNVPTTCSKLESSSRSETKSVSCSHFTESSSELLTSFRLWQLVGEFFLNFEFLLYKGIPNRRRRLFPGNPKKVLMDDQNSAGELERR